MNNLAIKSRLPFNRIEEFFNDFFDWDLKASSYYQEPANYFFDEETKEYVINVQAPGFKREEIEIETDPTGISINGEIKDEDVKKRIGSKRFSYKMKRLGIDSESVQASLENGILEIRLKIAENKETKKIPIK